MAEEKSSLLHFQAKTDGLRLDKYISQAEKGLSRSYIQRLIREGYVKVNGSQVKASFKLKIGDEIALELPPPVQNLELVPEAIPLKIIYQDSNLIVIDKPNGIAVHPAPGHPRGTLVNALINLYPELLKIDSSGRPGIVHRLDKDTSGLMVIAKNKPTQLNLAEQIKNHSMLKQYLVLVRGKITKTSGVIEAQLSRHPKDRKRMAVVSSGREAKTFYQVLKYFDDYTLISATLFTGRTHQIRVHFAFLGYPVIGDPVYGVKSAYLGRQFLHAYRLGFKLPGNGEYRVFHSKLPPELRETLKRIPR
jgi:23S rRNA pseudouridine1911/1915/1917 synthase